MTLLSGDTAKLPVRADWQLFFAKNGTAPGSLNPFSL